MPIAEPRALPIQDHEGLRQSLQEADIATLLMVYVHLSGDEAELEHFAAHLGSPYAQPRREVPEALAVELRERLFELLTGPARGASRQPSTGLMQRMMSINVGEPVADEFVPMLMEQGGFHRPAPRKGRPGRARPPEGFKVLVIGAGLAGIAASIKLQEAGYEHMVVEKNADIGGAWFENRYPGVGVDTPSHFYSYSWAINPEWSHYHPKGGDMHAYLLRVVDDYGVRNRTVFNTRVSACVWDEARALWQVTLQQDGREDRVVEANAIYNPQGEVNRWELPKIPGLDRFRGPAMHTAGWDPAVQVEGKRVVMIGTGASGVQLGPALARQVKQLTICQRSRHWVMRNPEVSKPVSAGVKFALRHIPNYKEWFRFRVFWFCGDGLFVNVVKDPSWPHQDRSVSAHNDALRQYALDHLRSSLEGRPDLFEKLLPDHPIFSKRILQDEGWLDCLKRDNVTLEAQAVDHVEEDAVVMADGTRHEADVLALATGFNVARMIGSLKVIGRAGRCLNEEWGEEDPRSYLGVTLPGYPNFFFSVGPNSAPNHAGGQNLVSEAQVHYMIECLDALVAAGARSIEPRQAAYEAWNAKIDRRMQDMIWSHPKAESYYNNSQRRNFLSWPYRLVDYWKAMRAPDLAAFELQ
jgi:4-hydroxyacetophenone monooxygenase